MKDNHLVGSPLGLSGDPADFPRSDGAADITWHCGQPSPSPLDISAYPARHCYAP